METRMRYEIFVLVSLLVAQDIFGMEHVALNVAGPREAWSEDNVGIPDGCCAICWEKVDEVSLQNAMVCWHKKNTRITCPTCHLVYHRSCLEKFFSDQQNRLAKSRQCIQRCGTELISPPCLQRFKRLCRKYLLSITVLMWLDLVAIVISTKYDYKQALSYGLSSECALLSLFAMGAKDLFNDLNSSDMTVSDRASRDRYIWGVIGLLGAAAAASTYCVEYLF
jgi:hypothetical protein